MFAKQDDDVRWRKSEKYLRGKMDFRGKANILSEDTGGLRVEIP